MYNTKNKRLMSILKTTLCLCVCMVGLATIGFAEDIERVAKIGTISGKAFVKFSGQKAWLPADEGMILKERDIIQTRKQTQVVLYLMDGNVVSAWVDIKANSQLRISELKGADGKETRKTLLDLGMGKILIKVQKLYGEGSKFEVKTPTSIVGVRGTTFAVEVEGIE